MREFLLKSISHPKINSNKIQNPLSPIEMVGSYHIRFTVLIQLNKFECYPDDAPG
mgnify:CR=1 FL=1